MVGHAYGNAGNMPVSSQGISVSEKGVQVSYFGKNNDGEGVLLRRWEQTGISGNYTVKLPDGVKVSSVQPVNLLGEKQGNPIQVKSGQFTVALKGYTPASFVLLKKNTLK